jgi:hypothetical protein
VRLLLDADLSPKRIGGSLVGAGHDVRAIAAERELEGLHDERVLELATEDGRVLVTRNSRHFVALTRTWAEAGREHAGVILIWSFSHRQFAEISQGIDDLCKRRPEQAAWRDLVLTL